LKFFHRCANIIELKKESSGELKMNDIFIEQLVKKKRTVKERVLFIAVIILVIVIPALIIFLAANKLISAYFIMIALFIFLFGVWYIWFFRSHQNIEFEYQVVSDYLVVSKIIAKRKRKEMLKLDIHNIDILAKGDDSEINGIRLARVIEACENVSDDSNNYYAVYKLAEGSKRALIFNPNEKILNAMKPYLKKDIVLKLFYNR